MNSKAFAHNPLILGGFSSLLLVVLTVSVWAAPPSPVDVPNFHRVDDHVCRGAQPDTQGWKDLAHLGVKVVLDLRPDGELQEHWSRLEEKAVQAAGMRYISLPMQGWALPKDVQITRALEVLRSGESVFVHCRGGKDRTGTVIACYRIAQDHWDIERALAEARSDGMNPLQIAMEHYILGFHPSGSLATVLSHSSQ
jgi:tyrosine-protein phosphatase SIW14